MNLLENINSTAFKKFDQSSRSKFLMVDPSSLPTSSLLLKVRYHMKQVLGCLLELKKRNVLICESLSGKEGKVIYNKCNIVHDDNRIKMLLDIEGRKK